MAFPVVAATNTTADTDALATVVNMPSGIVAGNLLLVFCAHDSATLLTAVGWTRIDAVANGSAVSHAIFAKIAAGADTCTTVGTTGQDAAFISVRITGHGVSDVSTDIVKGTAATGTDAAPNPPNCNPGSTKDWLWLETFAADDDDDTATYWSTSYSAGNQVQSANSTSSVLVAFGQRNLSATAENPGVMALAATEEWIAQTLAIPPVAVQNYSEPVNETVTLSDGLTAVKRATPGVPETVTLSDGLTAVKRATPGVPETVTLSDSLLAARHITNAPAEEVSFSEGTLDAEYGAVATAPETVAFSDGLGSLWATAVNLPEEVTHAEQAIASVAKEADLSEEVTFSESALFSRYGAIVVFPETVVLSENISNGVAFLAGLPETVALSVDALASVRGAYAQINENVALAEGVTDSSNESYQEGLAEAIALAEAIVARVDFFQGLSDNVALSDFLRVLTSAQVVFVQHSVEAKHTVTLELTEVVRVFLQTEGAMTPGNRIRLKATFRHIGGRAFDPAALVLQISTAAGVVDCDIVQAGAGVYYCDYLIIAAGVHRYEWVNAESGNEIRASGRFLVSSGIV